MEFNFAQYKNAADFLDETGFSLDQSIAFLNKKLELQEFET